MSYPFFTVGHSTRSIEQFVNLLRVGGVELVVDIRSLRRSRANPQYNTDVLPAELQEYDLAWDRIEELGGLRPRSPEVAPDVNGYWQNRSFHNYADYALGSSFGSGFERLLTLGRQRPTAVMCAEAVWWRCHRRIVADHLIARGEQVMHLMGRDRLLPATLTPGAVVDDGKVRYPLVK